MVPHLPTRRIGEELGVANETYIPVDGPFDFHLTVGHQTYYRGRAGSNLYADGAYYRALRKGEDVVTVAAREADRGVTVSLPNGGSDDDLAFATSAVSHLLGLDAELEGFYEMFSADPVLAGTVGELRGLRPSRAESVFEALVMAVIAQQISGAVARAVREALVSDYGTPVEADGHTLYAFPTPRTLAEAGLDELRAHKLSARKAEYIADIAARTLDRTIDPVRLAGMDDEAVITELSALRGIGRWTAEWVLMGALGRPDVFPAGDLALRKVVERLYFAGREITPAELTAFGIERWSPYRGLATTYLFAHLRQQRLADERAKGTGDATL